MGGALLYHRSPSEPWPCPSSQLALLTIATQGLNNHSSGKAREQMGEVFRRMTGQELKTSWLPWVGGWWAEEGDGGDAWFRLGQRGGWWWWC